MIYDLNNLTDLERKYFKIMRAKYGVLFITAKPGVAKSAIMRSIADKMDYNYIDLRLSLRDETDVGLYPTIIETEVDGKVVKFLDHVVPLWAKQANERPTIIHFEELNRCSLPIRNAALGILLERIIGDFTFNENVLMVASGNLGDEDDTQVEEMDAAMNGRLIHIAHEMSVEYWLENFAKENVHPVVYNYIKSHPEQLYPRKSDNTKAYASNRSWTMLSEYIIVNYGKDSDISDYINDIEEIGSGYIGNSIVKFHKYLRESIQLNIKNILIDFEACVPVLKKFNRDKISELLFSLRDVDIYNLKKEYIDNLIKFLDITSTDERMGYINYIIEHSNSINKKNENFRRIIKNDEELIRKYAELSSLKLTKKL